jgi:hypothetical protein
VLTIIHEDIYPHIVAALAVLKRIGNVVSYSASLISTHVNIKSR